MKRFFKRLLKILLGFLLIGVVAFGVLYMLYDQPLPQGTAGPQADALAEKMLKAVNNEQYKKTRYLEWTFAGGAHRYQWDKQNGRVQVSWRDYKVDLDLNTPEKSVVYEDNTLLMDTEAAAIVEKALAYFNNDSFWLVAPFKVFDKGTSRSLVDFEDGSQGLLVIYSSGGTTPGDAYLWKLGPTGFPESYQMWVHIIPIGGVEASWDDWKVMQNGLSLPASHKIGPLTLHMGDVKAYD